MLVVSLFFVCLSVCFSLFLLFVFFFLFFPTIADQSLIDISGAHRRLTGSGVRIAPVRCCSETNRAGIVVSSLEGDATLFQFVPHSAIPKPDFGLSVAWKVSLQSEILSVGFCPDAGIQSSFFSVFSLSSVFVLSFLCCLMIIFSILVDSFQLLFSVFLFVFASSHGIKTFSLFSRVYCIEWFVRTVLQVS